MYLTNPASLTSQESRANRIAALPKRHTIVRSDLGFIVGSGDLFEAQAVAILIVQWIVMSAKDEEVWV